MGIGCFSSIGKHAKVCTITFNYPLADTALNFVFVTLTCHFIAKYT